MSSDKLIALQRSVLSNRFIARMVQTFAGKQRRDFAITAVGNFSIALSSAVGGIMAARLLGPEGRGELAAAFVWAGILGTVASVGLPQALTFFVAQDSASFGRIYFTALVLLFVQSLGIIVLGWLAVSLVLIHAQPAAVYGTRLYLFSIPFSLLTTYLSTIAQGLKRFGLFNTLRVASATAYPLVMAAAIAFGTRQATEIVGLLLCAQIFVALASLVLFSKLLRPRGRFDSQAARQLLGYGFKSYWGSLSWIANARLDQFVMSAFVSLAELGQYAVAVSYATVLFPLSSAFAMVLFPRVAGGDRQDARRKIGQTLKLNLVASAGGAVVLGLVCPVVLPWLFGPEFQAAVYPAIILLAGTVFLGSNYVLSDGIRGMGSPTIPSVAEAVGLVVTVGGLFALIPHYGIVGAAWVSLFSYATVTLFLLYGLKLRSQNAALKRVETMSSKPESEL